MKSRSKRARTPGRDVEEVRERDPDGAIVVHHRTVDSLVECCGQAYRPGHVRCREGLRSKLHPRSARSAACRADFEGARHWPRARPERAPAGRSAPRAWSDGGVGRHLSPAGSCVWHIVGLQRSVREWAIRQGWGGRPVDHKAAAGILIAGLGMLAAHWDTVRATRPLKMLVHLGRRPSDRRAEIGRHRNRRS